MPGENVTLKYLPVEGYAVLDHVVDSKGKLDSLIAVSVVGFYLDPEGRVALVQTARGREPNAAPLLGPCGEVTMGRSVWPGVDDYGRWAEKNMV